LAISDSESTDTPGRPAGRERTAASDAPELEFLAGAELLCSERRQDPGEGEIPVPGSVTVEEGRGARQILGGWGTGNIDVWKCLLKSVLTKRSKKQ